MALSFDDFTDAVPAAGDYVVGYAIAGGAGSDRKFLRSHFANPPTDDGMALGNTSGPLRWSDFFLAAGGVINWNSGVGTITEASGSFTWKSTAAATWSLEDTDAGAAGPILTLFHNSASPANADVIAALNFNGKSSNGTTRTYGKETTTINDVTDGSEDAMLIYAAMKAGTLTNVLTLDPANGIKLLETVTTATNGLATNGIKFGTAGVGIFWGTGAPNFTAPQGSLYINVAGGANTRLYSNNNGSNGWSAMTG